MRGKGESSPERSRRGAMVRRVLRTERRSPREVKEVAGVRGSSPKALEKRLRSAEPRDGIHAFQGHRRTNYFRATAADLEADYLVHRRRSIQPMRSTSSG